MMLKGGGGVVVERLMLSLLTLRCNGNGIIGSTIRLNPDVLWTIQHAKDSRQGRTVFMIKKKLRTKEARVPAHGDKFRLSTIPSRQPTAVLLPWDDTVNINGGSSNKKRRATTTTLENGS